MSSLHRTLSGDVLVHHLTEDEMLVDRGLVEAHGRSARTLVKEGPLRLTLIALAAQGTLPPHSTSGPIMIQLLDGDIVVEAAGKEYPLAMQEVLVIASRVEHSARSTEGGSFLLTVIHVVPEEQSSPVQRA